MNNTVLKVVAALLVLGAIVVAVIGVQLSQQPPAPPQVKVVEVPVQASQSIIVAARPIRAGQSISDDDLTSKSVQSPPAQAFGSTQEIVGKIAVMDVAAGTPLLPSLLASDSMASLLKANEKAIAIHVDEVMGVGGFIHPGDRVDVLLYMTNNQDGTGVTSAQVVLSNVKLLTVGDVTQIDLDKAKQGAAASNKSGLDKVSSGGSGTTDIRERRQNMRSVVMAVPEKDLTRLLLAAGSGQLRLALRSQLASQGLSGEASAPAKSGDSPIQRERRLVTLSEIAPAGRKAPANAVGAPPQDGIIIQEGSKERRLAKQEASVQP